VRAQAVEAWTPSAAEVLLLLWALGQHWQLLQPAGFLLVLTRAHHSVEGSHGRHGCEQRH